MKKILFASIGLLSLSAISFTYADEVKSNCNGTGWVCEIKKEFKKQYSEARSGSKEVIKSLSQKIKENREMAELNKKSFHADFRFVQKYLAKPLTWETRVLVNKIIKSKDDAMKELQKTTNALIRSWTVDRSGYIAEATNIITWFRASILPYIATWQLTGFDAFIQAKVNLMISNVALRQANTNTKMEIWNKKLMFKEWLKIKKTEYKDLIKSIKKAEIEDDEDDDKYEDSKLEKKNKEKMMKKFKVEDDDDEDEEDEEDDD